MSPIQVALITLIPVAAMAVSALVATARPLSPRGHSLLQHFAAGLVIAIVAVELLPEVHGAAAVWVSVGFALGVVAMLAVRALGKQLTERGDRGRSTAPLLITVGIDLVLDGVLLGIAFTLGSAQGLLLTIALTVEVVSLGTTVAAKLQEQGASRRAAVLIPLGLALLMAIGAVLGRTILGGLSGAPFAVVISFGMAALLYLVVEELLVEAHEEEDTTSGVVAFFVGFLALLLMSAAT